MRRAQDFRKHLSTWFVVTQRIVHRDPDGLFAPTQRIAHPAASRPARQPTVEPGQVFWKKGRRIRGSGTESRYSTNSYPRTHYFFWKWEGEFAAQERKVDSQDFWSESLEFCLRKPSTKRFVYKRFVEIRVQKEAVTGRIASESLSVDVSRFSHENPERISRANLRLRNTKNQLCRHFALFFHETLPFFALNTSSKCNLGGKCGNGSFF